MLLAQTSDRVQANTAEEINSHIQQWTKHNVSRYAQAGPAAIDRRLAELDAEWDIERYLETMAPSFTLAGLLLGITINRKWLLLPIVVQSFFLQHALQGWCPPIPVLRRLGVRTADEINQERYALKALRGDFEGVYSLTSASDRASEAVAAVRS
jgi:hypothetical protein